MILKNVVQNVKQVYPDNHGRLIVIDFEVQNFTFRLINVYASNIESERRDVSPKNTVLRKLYPGRRL